ncbi:MAG: L-lactate dehydrogenase [Bacilli bacterium]
MNKVIIIGCGNVGMSYAYALVNQKTNVKELVLIDIDKQRIIGEVMDLNHCLAFAPNKISIKAGDYKDCCDADIIVIAAGSNQAKGETRMDLIYKNSKIFKDIIDNVMVNSFKGIFLVATNPLDVMTYLTWKYSKLPANHIIGTGTNLDTARLKYIIAKQLQINPNCVHAYVIGEHGDSEFVPWSNAFIGSQSIYDYLGQTFLDQTYVDVRDAAYEIINKKGSTCYGIGMCLVRITKAILDNENSIIVVSSYDNDNHLFIGGPTIINKNGVRNKVNVTLTKEEKEKLDNSIRVVKKAIEDLESGNANVKN